jgi:hypothetical protein
VWGLPETRKKTWEGLKQGDLVFFYVQSPISAVVGYGEIQKTFRDSVPFFADDQGASSIWPFRFSFQIILPSTGDPIARWARISVANFLKFPRLKRFERLKHGQAQELLQRCRDLFGAKPAST